MFVCDPLWGTWKKGLSTYTLRAEFRISGSTVQRLRKNMPVFTNTLDDLCNSSIALYQRLCAVFRPNWRMRARTRSNAVNFLGGWVPEFGMQPPFFLLKCEFSINKFANS